MNIKKLRIQNFYSFKNATLDLSNAKGITVIDGHNKDTTGSNGAGKSVLIEAVYFGLTGKTIRKSTDDALVNNEEKKKCQVEVFLDDDVRILRQKKPTKLNLYVRGEDKTQHTIFDTQSLIDEMYKTNYKVLLASMFFGQSNDLNFLDCSAEDKRNIIKHFLALDDIFIMRDRIKAHKASFYQAMKEQDAITAEHSRTVTDIGTRIENIDNAKKRFSDYKDYSLDISLEDIVGVEQENASASWQMAKLARELDDLNTKKNKTEKQLSLPAKERKCSACNQTVKTKTNKNIKSEIESIEKAIEDNITTSKGLSKKIKPLDITSKMYSKYLEYRDLCRDATNYEEIKESLLGKIEACEKVKAKNKVNYEVMRFWEKAFSQQGIIKYIIKNVLDYLNDRINYYLSFLTNSKYLLKFNEELIEQITANNRQVQYISLSGGERRKVNLAVTLSLKDLLLLSDKKQPNLLFFDEIAENLDEEGITGLHGLLQEIKANKKVFVITHNKYLKSLLYSANKLTVIKKNGVSKIKGRR
tara:strand:- start:467 stop:2050 length:1584 start_codon:yes stop_codon:yes gene_type:complete